MISQQTKTPNETITKWPKMQTSDYYYYYYDDDAAAEVATNTPLLDGTAVPNSTVIVGAFSGLGVGEMGKRLVSPGGSGWVPLTGKVPPSPVPVVAFSPAFCSASREKWPPATGRAMKVALGFSG